MRVIIVELVKNGVIGLNLVELYASDNKKIINVSFMTFRHFETNIQ